MADELAQDGEVGLVRREREHDQVGVEACGRVLHASWTRSGPRSSRRASLAVQRVACVWVVVGGQALLADVLHDLVLA